MIASPLKYLCSPITRGSSPDYAEEDGDALAIGQSCQRPDGSFDITKSRPHRGPVPEKGRLHGGEVVVNSTGVGTLGRVALVPPDVATVPMFADTHVSVIRPTPGRVDARYLRYVLTRKAFRTFAEDVLAVGSTKQRELSASALGSTRIPLVDLGEQHRLVEFLDMESERLASVRARLNVLEARALEPALARAEQAWLHQPLGKIGYRFAVQLGKKLYENRIDHATAKPYLRNANVHWDRFVLDDVKIMNFEGAEVGMYSLCPGDLLVCEGGEPGRSAVWEGQIAPCYFQMALNRVRPYGLDSTRWVMWALRSQARNRGFTSDGPGRYLHLTAEQLRATRIPLPSPEIQHRLVAEIDAEANRARRLSALAKQLDERLAEYRDAMITAAVHGRLDLSRFSDAELDERLHAFTDDLMP